MQAPGSRLNFTVLPLMENLLLWLGRRLKGLLFLKC